MYELFFMAILALALVAGVPRRRLAGLALVLCAQAWAEDENSILLVADPGLESPVFGQSVVLVTPWANGSAIGLIINHPQLVDSELVFPDDELLQDAGMIRFGGPVGLDRMSFLFRAEEEPDNAIHLFADVYVSNDRELLEEQLLRPRQESRLRVYLGYAGGAPGQLQAEISLGDWRVVKVSVELLFHTDRELIWRQLSKDRVDDWI